MQKHMTITLDETIYNALCRIAGKDSIDQFTENLLRQHIFQSPTLDDAALEAGYKAMAADEVQEREAKEWINAVVGDIPNEPW